MRPFPFKTLPGIRAAGQRWDRGDAIPLQVAPSVQNPAPDFRARLNGLDPQSPYVTQRPQSRGGGRGSRGVLPVILVHH